MRRVLRHPRGPAVVVVVNESLKPRQIEHILRHSDAAAVLSAPEMLQRLGRPLETSAAMLDVAQLASVPRADSARGGASARTLRRSSTRRDRRACPRASRCRTRTCGPACKQSRVTSASRVTTASRTPPVQLRLRAEPAPLRDRFLGNTGHRAVAGPAAHREDAARAGSNGSRDGAALVVAAADRVGLRARAHASLRCMTNTGGLLPADAVRRLRTSQPHARLYLMYGLTEAFRRRVPRSGQGRREAGLDRRRHPGRRAPRRARGRHRVRTGRDR